jgi:NIMA-interacting peptidyl-prolyl cis-trans isomerase 4
LTYAAVVLILQVASEFSECPSGKKGGDLGWFPRGKMAGPFQEVAFNTPVGATSAPFKSTYVNYHWFSSIVFLSIMQVVQTQVMILAVL